MRSVQRSRLDREHVLDLYAGVGLFAAASSSLSVRVGESTWWRATTSPSRRPALTHDEPIVHVHHDRVDRWLRRGP